MWSETSFFDSGVGVNRKFSFASVQAVSFFGLVERGLGFIHSAEIAFFGLSVYR
jgi:hypothetical protein